MGIRGGPEVTPFGHGLLLLAHSVLEELLYSLNQFAGGVRKPIRKAFAVAFTDRALG